MMKNRILIALLAAVCGIGQLAGAESKIVYVNSNTKFPLNLEDGKVYVFPKGYTGYADKNSWSAAKVEGGCTAWIQLEDAQVELTGGNASGATGAGAGIAVRDGAHLIIYGKGKLNATGGNAVKVGELARSVRHLAPVERLKG